MSTLTVLRSAVAIVDKVTKSLQPFVTYERATVDGYGTRTYAGPVQLAAIVDWKSVSLRTASGELTASRASVLFLDIAALNAATGGEGINDDDKITLPDGTTGPLIDMKGFIDAGTGHPIATEVFLG